MSGDSDRSSDEGDESEKEGSPQDTLPDHPYWDQPTGREARWGVWNTQNSLSSDDVPNSVLEWANARSLDAVLLSEPGLVSTSTTLFFRENGCQFFRTPPGTLSVAVILMPGIIPVGAPKASALGGTLTVRALVRGGVVSFTAVYQPTGLGTAPGPATYIPFPRAPPRSRGNLRKGTYTRAVGEYQRGVITKALTASGAHLAVAGGDFNEPPDPHLDRSLVVPNGPTRGKGRSHTVRRLLRSFVDLYRSAHPLTRGQVTRGTTEQAQGHTFYGGRGKGSSRLDLSLVYPAPPPGAARALVDTDYLWDGTDHAPVCFSAPIPSGLRHAHGGSRLPKPLRTRVLNTSDLSKEDQQLVFKAANDAVSELVPKWCPILDSLTPADPDAEKLLDNALAALRPAFFKAVHRVVGGRTNSGPSKSRPTPRLIRARRVRRLTVRIVVALRHSLAGGTAYSNASARAVWTLRCFGELDRAGLDPPPRWRDTAGWSRWLGSFRQLVAGLRKEVRAAVRAHPGHHSNRICTLFKTPKGRGRYYKGLHESNGGDRGICEFVGDDGVLDTDPTTYIDKVRVRVAKKYTGRKEGPAVYLGRPNTDDELRSGEPFWWKEMSTPPEGSKAKLSHVLAPASLDELFNWAHKPGDPTCGSDGISRLAISIALGPTRVTTPTSDFLLAYVNARYLTTKCPSASREGEMVFIPKPGKEQTGDDRFKRPLSMLSEVATKLPNGILAARILNAFHEHPTLLASTQRAYLHDGTHKQCVNVFVDLCEHALETGDTQAVWDFVTANYDQEMAFDIVQHFAIAAASRGIGFAENFVSYIMNTLTGTVRQVRTAHGLTAPFVQDRGIPQGDTLAAILWLIAHNPLVRLLNEGTLWRKFPRAFPRPSGCSLPHMAGPVPTANFADDDSTFQSGVDAYAQCLTQHFTILDHTAAVHGKVNNSKSICTMYSLKHEGDFPPQLPGLKGTMFDTELGFPYPRQLPGLDPALVHDPVNGLPASEQHLLKFPQVSQSVDPVQIRSRNFIFRMLGLQVAMTLPVSPSVNVLQGRLHGTMDTIKADRLLPLQTHHLLTERLVPQVEMCLTFFGHKVPSTTYAAWHRHLRTAVLQSAARGPHVGAVCTPAVQVFMGVPDLRLLSSTLAAIEMAQCLRSPCSDAYRTSWARVLEAVRKRQVRVRRTTIAGQRHAVVVGVRKPSKSLTNRAVEAIRYLLKSKVTLSWPVDGAGERIAQTAEPISTVTALGLPLTTLGIPILELAPLVIPIQRLGPVAQPIPLAIFPDGSFFPRTGKGGSGLVICKQGDIDDGVHFDNLAMVTRHIPAPSAGASYGAEAAARVHALLCCPSNCPISLYPDCEPGIKAATKLLRPVGTRLRSGNRALITTERSVLDLRSKDSGTTSYTHILAHTEGDDIHSLLNDRADQEAKRGVGDEDDDPVPPCVVNEESAIFWEFGGVTPPIEEELLRHVSGSLSVLLRRKMSDAVYASWEAMPTQGVAVSSNRSSFKKLLKLAVGTADTTLHLFLMLFVTRQSPTADRMVFREAATAAAIKCPIAGCNHAQSAAHVFSCRASRSLVAVQEAGVREIVDEILTLSSTEHTGQFRATSGRWLSFYLPLGRDPVVPPPVRSVKDAALVRRFKEHDRVAGTLGILPRGLQSFLFPTTGGLPKPVQKLAASLFDELQLFLLRSALRIFTNYQQLATGPALLTGSSLLVGRELVDIIRERARAAAGAPPPQSATGRSSTRNRVRTKRGAPTTINARAGLRAARVRHQAATQRRGAHPAPVFRAAPFARSHDGHAPGNHNASESLLELAEIADAEGLSDHALALLDGQMIPGKRKWCEGAGAVRSAGANNSGAMSDSSGGSSGAMSDSSGGSTGAMSDGSGCAPLHQ